MSKASISGGWLKLTECPEPSSTIKRWFWRGLRDGHLVTIPCTAAGWVAAALHQPQHGDRVQVVGARAPNFVYYDHYLIGRKGGYWAIEDDVQYWMPQPQLPGGVA